MKKLKFLSVFFLCGLSALAVYSQQRSYKILKEGSDIIARSEESGWISDYVQIPLEVKIRILLEKADSLEKEIVNKGSNESIKSKLQGCRAQIDGRKKKIALANEWAYLHYFEITGGDLKKIAKENDPEHFKLRRIVILSIGPP